MTRAGEQIYRARIQRVLAYIDNNLQADLSVDRLSAVAAFSKYHFHRQFSQLLGVNVHRYIQLRRLKRATFLLAHRRHHPITEIALDAGYENAESFTRAFRNLLGQTPSDFRKTPQWLPWFELYQPVRTVRSTYMKPEYTLEQVDIINFPATRVAVYEHRGDPNGLYESIQRFIEWRKANLLPPKISNTFNIAHNDPDEVGAENFHFDLCAATEKPIAENDYGVVAKTLPAGRCAVLRHIGSDDHLIDTIRFLYAHWLPQSESETRDFPLFFQRIRFFPDVPEHEAATDVFLPIR